MTLPTKSLTLAIATIPWHWLYYGYSELAFEIETLRHVWRTVVRGNKRRLPQAS